VSAERYDLLASSPRGLADLLARELESVGATGVRERSTDVAFRGTLEVAYRACLESRVANRVYLLLSQYEAVDAEQFYRGARAIDWAAHIAVDATIACDFTGRHPAINHSHFGALKLKDAIVDSLRESSGSRPDIAREHPDVRIHAHAQGSRVTVALDLSGESLHRRGYRGAAGEAPLKENVAAGVLLRAGWREMAATGAEFLDPMCGAGTFPIEAAMIAADIAPGLRRDYFGFIGWKRHDRALWEQLREVARARVKSDVGVVIRGEDRDSVAIRVARANAERAGVSAFTRFETRPASESAPGQAAGLLCVNPPYGVRLEDHEGARAVHRELGRVLREQFSGWSAAVLTGAPDLGLELGVRAFRTHTLWNGAIECRLLRLKIEADEFRALPGHRGAAQIDAGMSATPGAKMFANRLGKNLKRLEAWARKSGVSCFRLYDADMPEYSFAIDCYRTLPDSLSWLYVQEYAAPATVDAEGVRKRRKEALSVLPGVTGIPPERIRMRMRRQQKGREQYEKLDRQGEFHQVEEGGLKFEVNFDDYLDTGIFLDHRLTRARLREAARGKRFLNLFAYTATASVHAASGGALSTVSVDLSNTYLDWAQRNFMLNGHTSRGNSLVQADCREWLAEAAAGRERYDLIFLDPPTFSNSKRMEGVLDIRRDHPAMIDACARVLAPGGLLVFSTNAQKFKLDAAVGGRYPVRDVSKETLPVDFERNPHIHRCFEIRQG
jgi:23S rRNA (guanine2445-N2)-methyltransferase / 23S rRNA (guanine2069-N7)-methyltransferase